MSAPHRGSDSHRQQRGVMRLASSGFELAVYGLVLGALGYGVDSWLGLEKPYIGITGLLLGVSLGFFRLIWIANRLDL